MCRAHGTLRSPLANLLILSIEYCILYSICLLLQVFLILIIPLLMLIDVLVDIAAILVSNDVGLTTIDCIDDK